jgi:hypothetical protein
VNSPVSLVVSIFPALDVVLRSFFSKEFVDPRESTLQQPKRVLPAHRDVCIRACRVNALFGDPRESDAVRQAVEKLDPIRIDRVLRIVQVRERATT